MQQTIPFRPRVAIASLSGESDAAWAKQVAPYIGCAFLGGIAIDETSRMAAQDLVARERTEFLPPDPVTFIDDQFRLLSTVDIRPAINVRSTSLEPIQDVAAICYEHNAILEINAHCRQDEMCQVGAGQSLLQRPDALCEQVSVAAEADITVSVKVRTEVPGVSLPSLCADLIESGASILHVDAMDSESVIADLPQTAWIIANNGVRDRKTTVEYLAYGADAVSIGRPSDRPIIVERVRTAVMDWFREQKHPIQTEQQADA